MGAMKKMTQSEGFKSIVQKVAGRENKPEATAQATQATPKPAERENPFTARRRGQAANILAGDQQATTRQKRLLGE